MKTGAALLILSVWAALASAVPGWALTPTAPQGREAMTATSMSMDDAIKMVEQRFRARVVKAETETDAGHTVYVLRLLDDSGKVWTVRVDAESGSVQ
jgi:uncharacterized membrane protein YkoI